jgi:hypothetical protein
MTNQRLQDCLALLQMMQNWQRFPTVVRSLSEAAQQLIRREITEQEQEASADSPAALSEGADRAGERALRPEQESNIDNRPDNERREFLRRLLEEEKDRIASTPEGSKD